MRRITLAAVVAGVLAVAVGCGSGGTSSEFTGAEPARWEITDLGLSASGEGAVAINERGEIVVSDGYLWRDGKSIGLGTLGGNSTSARAINDGGQVAGTSDTNAEQYGAPIEHAFLWQDGTMTDLGTLGGQYSEAVGINNHGQVVGVSETDSGDVHAFLWQKGKMRDLGVGSIAMSSNWGYSGEGWSLTINERGQIVGSHETDARNRRRGYRRSRRQPPPGGHMAERRDDLSGSTWRRQQLKRHQRARSDCRVEHQLQR